MAITSYDELRATIATWMRRTDLTDQIPEFIALAEIRLATDVVSRVLETSSTVTTTAGVQSVPLPTGFLRMHRLTVQTDPVVTLKYVSPDELATSFPWSSQGRPVVFSTFSGNILLGPTPDAAYTINVFFSQRVPSLSPLNQTNLILAASPNVYLYASLIYACEYIRDFDRMQSVERLYQVAVNNINANDWYTGTTMRVRAG